MTRPKVLCKGGASNKAIGFRGGSGRCGERVRMEEEDDNMVVWSGGGLEMIISSSGLESPPTGQSTSGTRTLSSA